MSPQQKRYSLYAAVAVVALVAGLAALYSVDRPLHDAVATAPLADGSPGKSASGAEKAESAAKSPSERAEQAAIAAGDGAAKELPSPAAQPAPAQAPQSAPSFDVVRVEPSGEALIAGRAAPNSEVELLAGGRVIASAKSNEAGEFVIMPERLAAGGHELTLRQGGGETVSARAVVVSVPSSPQGEVLVVAGEPGKPSEVLQAGAQTPSAQPQTAAAPAAAPSASASSAPASSAPAAIDMPLRIGSVEAEAGRLFVQGTGPAGARATIYLNDTAVSDAVVGADGRWSLTVERGLAPGSYGVRVDQVGSEGQVIARAAVPFEFTPERPVRTAAADQAGQSAQVEPPSSPLAGEAAIPPGPAHDPASVPPQPETSAQAPATVERTPAEAQTADAAPAPSGSAHPVVAEIGTVSVRRGDSLWRISRATYGQGTRYTVIYEANADQIRDPDLIYPGQVFVMPPRT